MSTLTESTAAVDHSVLPVSTSRAESPSEKERSLHRPGRMPADVDSRVMLVDDEQINIEVVKAYLEEEGYHDFCWTSNSAEAFELAVRKHPDIIVLDIMMPQVSGFDLITQLKGDVRTEHIPCIFLTATCDPETKLQALRLGATDFLGKPVDRSELVARLANVLSVKAYQDHLANYSMELERKVAERTAELEKSRQHVISCLARAAEYRDDDTGQHVLRVGQYAGLIAAELGFDEHFVAMIRDAAKLHDIGKIGIPDSVLLKAGRLDPEEFALIQTHCDLGRSVIQPRELNETAVYRQHADVGATLLDGTDSEIIEMAATIAQTHHERWDGSGYPLGLKGIDIPIEGRITAVADVYDALSSKRAYKDAFPRDKCFAILEEGRGKHFDPDVLDAFFARAADIVRVQIRFANTV